MTAQARAPAAHRRPAGRRMALPRHVAGLLPWGPLLAGCLTGIGVTAALRVFAGPVETPAELGAGVRASFVPAIAGLAFLLHDPQRQLTGALPAPPWLTSALRVALALPVLALTGAIQLDLAARALAVDLRAAGQPPAGLPWVALTAELAAWCAFALAFAAALERTRWGDLAGFAAAALALAAVGALAVLPLHLLPAAIVATTRAQQHRWTAAWRFWAAAGGTAALVAGWAVGDPWRRARLPRRPAAMRAR